MNRHSEAFRRALRRLLYGIVAFSVFKMVDPPRSETAAPICATLAVVGLACSCRPVETT